MFRAPPLPRTLEAALRDVAAAKPAVRADAVRDLVPHGFVDEEPTDAQRTARAQVLRALEAALRDDAAGVRSAAAVALADLAADEMLPALLIAVEDDDAHVRQMAINALGEIGDPRATERLRRALSDSRPEVRFQAAMAFPRVCASRGDAIEALVHATEDTDPAVCHIALRMAEELGDPGESKTTVVDEAVLRRARDLLDHDSALVRVAAAVVTARAGDDAGHPILVAAASGDLRTSDGEDESAAIELCGELGLRDARAGLERRAFGRAGLLGLRQDRYSWHARVALARMGHERAGREIVRDLTSWDKSRRTLAVAAAGRARLTAAREIIARMRGDDSLADPYAVDEALEALERAEAI
jgi:HEAT repeat protein